MFTEKDYLGLRQLQVFDEIVALQGHVGGVRRVCGVQAVGSCNFFLKKILLEGYARWCMVLHDIEFSSICIG